MRTKNTNDMTVREQLTSIKNTLCVDYCKHYASYAEDKNEDTRIILNLHCAKCPAWRI